jgi:hypothetical protein
MRDMTAVVLRDEIKRAAEQISPITVAELRARPCVDAEVGPDEVHGDVVVFDLGDLDRLGGADAGSTRTGPRWSAMAAVAAGVVLVVGGAVLALNRDDVVPEAASAPSIAEPVALPEVVDPIVSQWSLAPLNETGFGEMAGVTVGGPGFVAVGGGPSFDGSGDNAVVWTSVDGLTWSRVPHDEAIFGDAWMSDVTVGGPGLVAVGSDVWTSVDGLTWSRVPHDEAIFGDAMISDVTAGGPGFVAVGGESVLPDFFEGIAVVWTSVDGLTWSRVPHDEAVFGGPDSQMMLDVTIGGPGLVAVGMDGRGAWDNSEGQVAAVWTSVDGLTWSRVPHDEAVFGEDRPAMLGVTAGGPGLVAVGYSFPHSAPAAVWTSVDGVTWSRVEHDNATGMSGTMWSATVSDTGLVAVGQSGNHAAVWTSPDGTTWSRPGFDEADPDSAPDGSRMLAVNGTDTTLVAVGSLDPQDGGQAASWSSPNR